MEMRCDADTYAKDENERLRAHFALQNPITDVIQELADTSTTSGSMSSAIKRSSISFSRRTREAVEGRLTLIDRMRVQT